MEYVEYERGKITTTTAFTETFDPCNTDRTEQIDQRVGATSIPPVGIRNDGWQPSPVNDRANLIGNGIADLKGGATEKLGL